MVQAEDVQGLSGIAGKTCISVETLVELNPNLDPQALQVNNCVDLVVDGCKKLVLRLIARARWRRVALAPGSAQAAAQPPRELPARAWILVDADDGEVLAAHRARELATRSPRRRS